MLRTVVPHRDAVNEPVSVDAEGSTTGADGTEYDDIKLSTSNHTADGVYPYVRLEKQSVVNAVWV